LTDTLNETFANASFDFLEPFEFETEADDYGAFLILSGERLYIVRAGDEQIQVTVLGELPGGHYSETIRCDDGEIVETAIEYSYKDPRLPNNRLDFWFEPRDQKRFAPIRKLLREWGASAH
jgi:hypothetical protein